jgi:cytochrome b6-f complex iron-sulfur subunit
MQQTGNGTLPTAPEHTQALIARRRLIRLGWIAAGVVFVGGQIGLLLKLFFTPKKSGGFGSTITVGPVERFPVGSVTHFWKERFLLVHRPTGFLALAQECTHQKICNVDYLPERNILACPCHGAEYSLTGAVLAGPAPRPLDRYATTIRDGQVLVDTSRLLRSDAG